MCSYGLLRRRSESKGFSASLSVPINHPRCRLGPTRATGSRGASASAGLWDEGYLAGRPRTDPAVVAQHGRATIHSLHHTFASWLPQNGADIAEVRDVLGHSGVSMTLRYAHRSKGKTAKKMGSILNTVGLAE
jgi:integrase